MRLRNPLFAPADSQRKIDKALRSTADAVIFDLEDSVAPDAKVAAREAASAMLERCDAARIIVRVNAMDTSWYLEDLAAIVPKEPAAILLPKAAGPADLSRLDSQIDVLEAACGLPSKRIKIMLLATETAHAIAGLRYAGLSERLVALCFGAEDLSSDIGVAPRTTDGFIAPVASARSALVLAAAAAGVLAIDTPWPDPNDDAGLLAEAMSAKTSGFAGKLCIHPAQLDAVGDIFTPQPDEVAWARKVKHAFSAAQGSGVLSLEGKMVDRPHLRLAERVLSAAGE